METVTWEGIEYKVGDRFSGMEQSWENMVNRKPALIPIYGTLRFGLYDDAEGYSVERHLGFYIEVDSSDDIITLPDALTGHNNWPDEQWKKVE